MRKAFSIAELMIVVAIMGILAALVVPCLSDHTDEAKEAAAKDDLRILRSVIEFYAVRHGSVAPGYPDNNRSAAPTAEHFRMQTTTPERYLSTMPVNPFNKLHTIHIIRDRDAFPADASGAYGWVYQPATKEIRVDWPGRDREGIRYFDY